ncbi:MAG: TldD/PmbA family protein [Candidatus Bathyarchaeota archaeon]|nr:TldD/PmbA family protein [Candidatus Bathyarchaeota archaeon]
MAELNPEELLNFGERAIDISMKKGAQEAEAFLSRIFTTAVNIERGQIVGGIKRVDQGLGVRAIHKKAVGFSYTNILTDKTVKEAATNAFKSAKASKPDKNWKGLPNARKFSETKNTYDRRLVSVSHDELVETASTMLNTVENYDKRVLSVGGGVGTAVSSSAVVNSHGVEICDHGTSIECSVETIAREGNDVTPACFELDLKRMYDIDPEWVGREAARQAISCLKAKKIESGTSPIIFTQLALGALLHYTLINAVKANFVQRERSALKGKIGEKVASNLVTINDNGLLEGGLQTRKFDGEGVPTQKTLVIENGILKSYLYDNYTARKVGVESTGNAFRGGLASYASTPVLEATNFTFTQGNKPPEHLINEMDDGLIVYSVQGAHSSNPESGEFSIVATPAWKIEKGSLTHAAKGTLLAGTIFEVLENISALGSNTRKIGQLVAPWIQVENVKVIGG